MKKDALIESLQAKHGKESIMRLGDIGYGTVCEVIPTGSMGLDRALGCGGYPRGRVIEIFGKESSGKTTLALHAIANVQAKNQEAAFIDAEHALDPDYAEKLGVNTSNLIISQPDCGENALDIVLSLVTSGKVPLIVVDSVAALTPKSEIEGDMGAHHPGAQARLMSQGLRKICALASRHLTTIIFLNQLREKIGILFGSPEVTTGGNALKYYASVRIDVRRRQQVKTADGPVGNYTVAKVVKNKLAPPFKEAEFEILWGKGIDKMGDLIDVATVMEILVKQGSWYSFDGKKLGQGRSNVRKKLEEDLDLFDSVFDVVGGSIYGS